jgi:hypothetical protein
MTDESETEGAPARPKEKTPRPTEDMLDAGVRSIALARRFVVFLLAAWNIFAGLSLAIFQGNTANALGAGGGDQAAQRLVGVHMLMLAPVFFALAWKPEKYGVFIWLAYLSQAAIAAATAFDLLSGNLDVQDGALPLVVSLIFLALLVYLWVAGRHAEEGAREARRELAASREAGESSETTEGSGP